MKQPRFIPFWLMILLWVVTLALPWAFFQMSPITGIISGVILPLLWIRRMPTTCMSGTIISFPMAVLQTASGLVWIAKALRLWTA